MIHPDTELRFISPEIGYGVFAKRHIPRGTLIWAQCIFDRVFSADAVAEMTEASQEVLGHYAYIDLNGNYVLCWDGGRYVNHSCEPAMLGVDLGFEICVRDLQPGDEVTCEYGALNLTTTLNCRCQSALCRGTISGADTATHWPAWDALVAAALLDADSVPQPLLRYALQPQIFTDYAKGLKQAPSFREQSIPDAASAVPDGGLPWAVKSKR